MRKSVTRILVIVALVAATTLTGCKWKGCKKVNPYDPQDDRKVCQITS